MHSKIQTTFIGTHESVYGDSLAGKLEEFGLVRTMNIPLQQGFDSDSQACLSVGIDYLSTLAFEHGIVGTMPFANSTAVTTPFACMPTIHNIQTNMIVKTSLFKDAFEFEEWDTHNGSVEPLTFWIEFFEFFNSNISIVFDSKIDDFLDNLTEIGLDEIPFLVPQYFQLLFGFQGLEQSSPFHEFFTLCPYMLTKIGLIEYSAFWGNYAHSEMFGIDVDSENIFSMFDFIFFGQISNNPQVFGQPECFAYPTTINKGTEPLIVSILFDGNCYPVSRICPKLNKEVGFCLECFAVSGDVELDGQPIDIVRFLSPSISYETAPYLNIEGGGFLAS